MSLSTQWKWMKGQFGMTFISSGTVDFYYFHKALYFLALEKAVLTWMKKSILTTQNSNSTDSFIAGCLPWKKTPPPFLTCVEWDQTHCSRVNLHTTLPSHQAEKREPKNLGGGEGAREGKEIIFIGRGQPRDGVKRMGLKKAFQHEDAGWNPSWLGSEWEPFPSEVGCWSRKLQCCSWSDLQRPESTLQLFLPYLKLISPFCWDNRGQELNIHGN